MTGTSAIRFDRRAGKQLIESGQGEQALGDLTIEGSGFCEGGQGTFRLQFTRINPAPAPQETPEAVQSITRQVRGEDVVVTAVPQPDLSRTPIFDRLLPGAPAGSDQSNLSSVAISDDRLYVTRPNAGPPDESNAPAEPEVVIYDRSTLTKVGEFGFDARPDEYNYCNWWCSEPPDPCSDPGNLCSPNGIAYYDGKVYVTDSGASRITVWSADGQFLRERKTSLFGKPLGIAAADGELWVTFGLLKGGVIRSKPVAVYDADTLEEISAIQHPVASYFASNEDGDWRDVAVLPERNAVLAGYRFIDRGPERPSEPSSEPVGECVGCDALSGSQTGLTTVPGMNWVVALNDGVGSEPDERPTISEYSVESTGLSLTRQRRWHPMQSSPSDPAGDIAYDQHALSVEWSGPLSEPKPLPGGIQHLDYFASEGDIYYAGDRVEHWYEPPRDFDRVEVMLDGQLQLTDDQPSGRFTLDLDQLSGDIHTIEVVAYRNDGTTARQSNVLRRDQDAPRITLSGPLFDAKDGPLETDTAELHVSATDATANFSSGVQKLQVSIDDNLALSREYGCTPCPEPAADTFNYSKSVWGPGPHEATVTAIDAAGNATIETIGVDVPLIPADPACPIGEQQQAPSVNPVGTGTAVADLESVVPGATAPSEPTTDPRTGERIDPTLVQPPPTSENPTPPLESVGTLAPGKIATTIGGGVDVAQQVCMRPELTTAAEQTAERVNEDVAVYTNTAPETDTVVRPTAMGAMVIQNMRGENAPDELNWDTGLAEDEHLQELPNGAIAVVQELDPAESEPEPEPAPAEPATCETDKKTCETVKKNGGIADSSTQLADSRHALAEAEQTVTGGDVTAVITPVVMEQVCPADTGTVAWDFGDDGMCHGEFQSCSGYTCYISITPVKPTLQPWSEADIADAVTTDEGTSFRAAGTGSRAGNHKKTKIKVRHTRRGGPKRKRKKVFFKVTIDWDKKDCGNKPSPCGNFNRSAAVNYALTYGETPNSSYVDFESNDCTNFMSQIMRGGGMTFMREYDKGGGSWWYKSSDTYTHSWSLSDTFARHLWQYGLVNEVSKDPTTWKPGDLIVLSWRNGQPTYDHFQFVTQVRVFNNQRVPLVAQHSTDDYKNLEWPTVRKRIEDQEGPNEGSDWKYKVLRPVHRSANVPARVRGWDTL